MVDTPDQDQIALKQTPSKKKIKIVIDFGSGSIWIVLIIEIK
jgi:hypothetical protein